MRTPSRLLRKLGETLVAGTLQWLFLATASASVIGTFSASRANVYPGGVFSLLEPGAYITSARTALDGDGHTFVDLTAGISAASLAGVDVVYLPVANSTAVLSAGEVSALDAYVMSGGNLVIQGEFAGNYDNLLASFGATNNGYTYSGNPLAISNSYAPFTNGPYGSVTSIQTGAAVSFSLPVGGFFLDSFGVLGVMTGGAGLAAGAGTVILLGDINSFDGPGNTNGFAAFDGATLWRNIFAAADTEAEVPEPPGLILMALGVAGFVMARLRGRITASIARAHGER